MSIRVIHGDCLHELSKISGDFIIVTDPPFNIGYHYDGYKDNMPKDEYFDWLIDVFSHGIGFVIVHYPEYIYELSIRLGYAPLKVVSWVYNSNTGKQHRDIAFFKIKPDFRKKGQPYKNPTDKRIAARIAQGKMAKLYDWWNVNQVKNVSNEKTEHPCQMPVEVMENIIGIIPDALVVDPFGGSGTTGVACKNLGKDCILIEREKKYVDIINARLEL